MDFPNIWLIHTQINLIKINFIYLHETYGFITSNQTRLVKKLLNFFN